jgi:hypothetical protein
MDETDHGLTPQIADLKVNRKVNEINDLPTPPPRQCWFCVPPVIALKTRGPLIAIILTDVACLELPQTCAIE